MSKYPKPRNPTGKGGFKKGQSGNPGGRGAVTADVRALAREHTAVAIQALFEIASCGRSEMARIAASDSLLDRGYGRPTQMLANDPENPFPAGVQFYMPANPRDTEPVRAPVVAGGNGSGNGNGKH